MAKGITFALCTVLLLGAVSMQSLSLLENLDNSEFGSSILDLISIRLENGDAVGIIVTELNKMAANINREQKADDHQFALDMAKCKRDIAQLNKEIASLTAEKNRLIRAITRLTRRINALNARIAKLKEDLHNYRTELAMRIAARKTRHAEYLRNKYEHEQAGNAIDAAIPKLEQMYAASPAVNAAKLVQLSPEHQQILAEVTQELASVKRDAKFGAIIHMIMSMVQKNKAWAPHWGAAHKKVGGIMTLLRKLRAVITSSLARYAHDEATQIAYFKAAVKRLHHNIRVTVAELKKVTAHRDALAAKRAGLQADLRRTVKQLNLKKKEKAEVIKECNEKRASYKSRTKRRNEDLHVIARVIKVLRTRLSKMSSYLKRRVAARGAK